MTHWEFLMDLNKACHFMSRERPGTRASNSELKRWYQNKAVIVNGERPGPKDEVDFPITEMVLFPKKHRVTLA